MPQMRTPMAAEVVSLHFLIWRIRFSSLASSPCCRVPIFRSRMHGNSKCDARFSSRMNSSDWSRSLLHQVPWLFPWPRQTIINASLLCNSTSVCACVCAHARLTQNCWIPFTAIPTTRIYITAFSNSMTFSKIPWLSMPWKFILKFQDFLVFLRPAGTL